MVSFNIYNFDERMASKCMMQNSTTRMHVLQIHLIKVVKVAISYLFLKENIYKRFYGVICSFSESLNEQSNDCSCTETQVLFVW